MYDTKIALFCDISFVKSIFVRWISCDNEVLCHVAARTLAILFSHEYLTMDQMSDLSELLLGVHETETPFATVPVTYRASRPGALLYGNMPDSSSDDSDSGLNSSDDSYGSPGPNINNNNGVSPNTIDSNTNTNSKNSASKALIISPSTATPGTNTTDGGEHHSPSASTSMDHAKFSAKLRESGIITNIPNHNSNSHPKAQKRITHNNDSSNGPPSESDSSEGDRTIEDIPFDIHWNNRLYSAMRVLTTIVGNEDVGDECVLALDEWFSTESVVIALFERSTRAGFGVLEAFLQLIKEILIRFCMNTKMGQSKMADVICANKGPLGTQNSDDDENDDDDDDFHNTTFNGKPLEKRHSSNSLHGKKSASARMSRKASGRRTPNHSHPPNDNVNDSENTNVLLEIIIRRTSTLVTRATALELCPLLMIAASDPEPFALQCLSVVLDDGRFNPFEPGDIHMTRTFKRGEHGKMRTI